MWSRVALTASLFVLIACTNNGGSSALESGAGGGPGTPTGTLVVTVEISAWASHPNATMPSEFSTSFRVTSPDSIELLKDATVTLTSATGKYPAYQQDGHRTGYWIGEAPGYDKVYVLDVVASTGTAEGLRIEGPSIHVFTHPAEGATIDPMGPTMVTWDSKDRANAASIGVDVTPSTGVYFDVDDSGEHSLTPDIFTRAAPNALQHRVALERTNTVTLEGEKASLRAGVLNYIHVMMPAL
jgi:hypothetical protein